MKLANVMENTLIKVQFTVYLLFGEVVLKGWGEVEMEGN